MNKKEVLKMVNRELHTNIKAWDNIYKGKVFVVAGSCRINGAFKTKRGAEGYIKRESNISYYDDYTQELIYPGVGLTIIEINENELLDYTQSKLLWYLEIKDKMGAEYLYDNIIYNAKKLLINNKDLLNYVLDAINDLKNGNGLTVYECKELLNDKIEELEKSLKYYIEENEKESIKIIKTEIKEIEEKLKKYDIIEVKEDKKENVKLTNTKNKNNIKVTYNTEKNGIELSFNEKPEQEIINGLKENGFRWHRVKKIWYAKDTEERRIFINGLVGNVKKKKNKKKLM